MLKNRVTPVTTAIPKLKKLVIMHIYSKPLLINKYARWLHLHYSIEVLGSLQSVFFAILRLRRYYKSRFDHIHFC